MDYILERHPNPTPRTAGISYRTMTMSQMQRLTSRLTEEEEASAFAGYYYQEPVKLQPHMEEILRRQPLKTEECLMPEQVGEILLSGGSLKQGYGVLENGAGYVCASIRYSNEELNDEMIMKYTNEFANEAEWPNVFYKVWCPGDHVIHFDDAIIESWGWGYYLQEMDMTKFRFSHLGLTIEQLREKDPSCYMMLGAGGRCLNIFCPTDDTVACMVQIQHETAFGRERHILYWYGMDFNPDGSMTTKVTVDRDNMEARMSMMIRHAMTETSNELRLIRQFCGKNV